MIALAQSITMTTIAISQSAVPAWFHCSRLMYWIRRKPIPPPPTSR